MGREEPVEIAKLSDADLKRETVNMAVGLSMKGFVPNGVGQLIFGSIAYRRESQFTATNANQGKYRGDPGYDDLWNKWIEEYDPYTGENLAGTAAYQHRRYSPGD